MVPENTKDLKDAWVEAGQISSLGRGLGRKLHGVRS
jgi:hypothetical protein